MYRTVEDLREELNLIQNKRIREWTEATLNKVHYYFFIASSSSSGKYHPKCTVKEGGLITHVKRAVYLANHICVGWGIFDLDRDIVISATILHDIAKTPNKKVAHLYSMITTEEDFVNHPINAKKYFDTKIKLNKKIVNAINKCIQYHMGRWTPDSIKKEIKEYSLIELAVYTADYLSSRKDLITPEDEIEMVELGDHIVKEGC